MKITAIIVNYESGSLAQACARSVREAWSRLGAAEDLDLVVVDQPGRVDQSSHLEAIAGEGARIVQSPVNDGYAGGMTRGLAGTSGADDDLVLILNPDVLLADDCLVQLHAHLRLNQRAGLVAPRTWLDESRTFLLPTPQLPGGRTELCDLGAARWPWIARRVAARRARKDWKSWLTEQPLECEMLPGSCLLMRRRLLSDLGVLLDPSFPLYYEDADLCRRVQMLGQSTVLVPGAEAVHFGARCSGTGEAFEGDPRTRWRESRDIYLQRHASPLGRGIVRAADRWSRIWNTENVGRAAHEINDLGTVQSSPALVLPLGGPWLVEMSLAPTFGFCAGAVLPGHTQIFPERTFDWLFEGTVYLRVLSSQDLRVFRCFSFTKVGGPIAQPDANLFHGVDAANSDLASSLRGSVRGSIAWDDIRAWRHSA
jgi:hypothetical protein